jgi:hypothetical protein
VEFECLSQIGEGFVFGSALACDIDFQALGNEPVSFAPSGRCERFLHGD